MALHVNVSVSMPLPVCQIPIFTRGKVILRVGAIDMLHTHFIGIYVFGAILEQFQSCSAPAKLDQKETPDLAQLAECYTMVHAEIVD